MFLEKTREQARKLISFEPRGDFKKIGCDTETTFLQFVFAWIVCWFKRTHDIVVSDEYDTINAAHVHCRQCGEAFGFEGNYGEVMAQLEEQGRIARERHEQRMKEIKEEYGISDEEWARIQGYAN